LPSLVGIWAALALRPSPSSRVASSAHPLSWRTSPRLILSSPLTYSVPWCHSCHWEARFSASAFVSEAFWAARRFCLLQRPFWAAHRFVHHGGLWGQVTLSLLLFRLLRAARQFHFACVAFGATRRLILCCSGVFSRATLLFVGGAFGGPGDAVAFAAEAFRGRAKLNFVGAASGVTRCCCFLLARPLGAVRLFHFVFVAFGAMRRSIPLSLRFLAVRCCHLSSRPLGPHDDRGLWGPRDAVAFAAAAFWGCAQFHFVCTASGAMRHCPLPVLLQPLGAAQQFHLFARSLGPCDI